MNIEALKECFRGAKKADEQGRKHKGLLLIKPNLSLAEGYISKAKETLEFCEIYRSKRADYKLPEEWFYAQYYCALAILSKFGIESRSQKCTAIFLRYAKDADLIKYDDELIDRITVHKEKEEESDVDKREHARYGVQIKNDEILKEYDEMMEVCKGAISQCEDIVYSQTLPALPKELLDLVNS